MTHRVSFLLVVGMLLLAGASLAAVCGNPDAETPTAELTSVASTSPAIPTAAATDTPIIETATAPAGTPVPTATLEDEPTSAPERINHLPTPVSSAEPMLLGGRMYVDARPATGPVLAYVNGLQCGEGRAYNLVDVRGAFTIRIESDSTERGCGMPGADVSFTINGRAIDQVVSWQPGYQESPATLSAGFQIGVYSGSLTVGSADVSSARVVPYVGDVVCGDEASGVIDPQQRARWVFKITVDSEDVRAGCGRLGADVTFRLENGNQPAVVIAVVPWQPLPPVELANVDVRSELGAKGAAE